MIPKTIGVKNDINNCISIKTTCLFKKLEYSLFLNIKPTKRSC